MHTNDTSLSDNSSEQQSNSLQTGPHKHFHKFLKSSTSPKIHNTSGYSSGNHSSNSYTHFSPNSGHSVHQTQHSSNTLPPNHPYHSIYSKLKNVPIPKDTTYTKIFVGGLPYHTTDETLSKHFEMYGRISEAVVITERQTGKSRGYGFVTMADRASAAKACINPNPIIDGRKANVNLAYIGAKPRIMHQNLLFRGLAATLASAGYNGDQVNYQGQNGYANTAVQSNFVMLG